MRGAGIEVRVIRGVSVDSSETVNYYPEQSKKRRRWGRQLELEVHRQSTIIHSRAEEVHHIYLQLFG